MDAEVCPWVVLVSVTKLQIGRQCVFVLLVFLIGGAQVEAGIPAAAQDRLSRRAVSVADSRVKASATRSVHSAQVLPVK